MGTQKHLKKRHGHILFRSAGATKGLNYSFFGRRTRRSGAHKEVKKIAIFDIDGTIFRSSLLIQFNKGLINMGVVEQQHLTDILDAYYAWVERRGSYTDYITSVVKMHARGIKGKERRYVQAVADLVFLHHRDRVYKYTRDLIQ